MLSKSIKKRLVDAVNALFPTVRSRLVLVLVACVLAIVFIVFAFQTVVVSRLLLIVWAAVSLFSLVRHLMGRVWLRRRQILWVIVIFARRFRHLFSVGRDVEFLYMIGLANVFVWLISALLLNSSDLFISNPLLQIAAVPFVLAGGIDATRIAKAAYRVTWVRWTGKIFYAGVAVFSVWAGGVMSAKLIAQATGLNPEYFATVGRLIQGGGALLIGLSMIVGVLSLLSLISYATIMLVSLLTLQVQSCAAAMPRLKPRCEKSSVVYRLMYGKNQLRGASKQLFPWKGTVMLMRPAGVLALGILILLGLGKFQDFLAYKLGPVFREMVVQIEFYSGQKCTDRIIVKPAKNLGDGTVAIASKTTDDWRFDVFVCERATRLPG